jgi:hypothetical protein
MHKIPHYFAVLQNNNVFGSHSILIHVFHVNKGLLDPLILCSCMLAISVK